MSSTVSSFLYRKKGPGRRNAAVHPVGVRGGRGKRGQSERAAANEDVESSGARKMGRPAFHPPPGAKGEGKGARSRAREGLRRRPGHRGRVSRVAALHPYSLACQALCSFLASLYLLLLYLIFPYVSSSFPCDARSLCFSELPESDILHVRSCFLVFYYSCRILI